MPKVIFQKSGVEAEWDGGVESILELGEANEIDLDYGCRAGNCGSCITAVRSGGVEYLNDPGAVIEEGSCLTCISVPRGNLVLDA